VSIEFKEKVIKVIVYDGVEHFDKASLARNIGELIFHDLRDYNTEEVPNVCIERMSDLVALLTSMRAGECFR
jgi:hypothetical protein